jgi:hypothetical protein
MSRPIDRSDVIAFFKALCHRESPLAFWSFDTSNGEQRLVDGYVLSVNGTLLEIEDLKDVSTFVIIAGVVFMQLELNDAPPPIRTIAKDSYDFVLGFQAGKYACCVMAKDLRNTVSAE